MPANTVETTSGKLSQAALFHVEVLQQVQIS